MNILGKILLKKYSTNTQSIVGTVIAGFVGIFSASDRIYLKDAANDGDRVLTAKYQFITNGAVIAKLQDESNWTENLYNDTDISIGEWSDVLPGQRLITQIPSGGRYYIINVFDDKIIRSSTSYQATYVHPISAESAGGTILASVHKLIPSSSYHITAYIKEIDKTIKTEIAYFISDVGNITWSSSPSLPAGSEIIIRL